MKVLNNRENFESALGHSLDICVFNVSGEPHHNMIYLERFLDFTRTGMCISHPAFCALNGYLDLQELYKDFWDYVNDFSIDTVDISIEDDVIGTLASGVNGFVIAKWSEIGELVKLDTGLYMVGFIDDRKEV